MLKKPTVLLILVLAGTWLAYTFITGLIPDETQITWLVEDMQEDFNNGAATGVGKGLSADFEEEAYGLDKRGLVLGLMHVMRQERASDGTFPLRAEIRDTHQITVHQTDPRTADVTVLVEFTRLRRGASQDAPPKALGLLQFDGKCRYENGSWRFVSSTHEVLEGRRPF